jgi:hypothetical protein
MLQRTPPPPPPPTPTNPLSRQKLADVSGAGPLSKVTGPATGYARAVKALVAGAVTRLYERECRPPSFEGRGSTLFSGAMSRLRLRTN